MGERKVLCKYFPPDFDPKKVPRMKRDPEKQIGVRMMIPFSMQCNTCGEFMYRGKKFNSLKEDCIGEDYLGIMRFRFYIKCVICSQEITFKTDPEKGDYELETGASRNFESWTDKQATEDEHKKAREEEEKSDNMKQLENRTLDSKIELEIMDALDEIKAVNRRHETVDTAEVLKASAARREKGAAGGLAAGEGEGEQDADEAAIAKIQFGGPKIYRRLEEGKDVSSNSDRGSDSDTGARAKADRPRKRKSGKGKVVEGKRSEKAAAAVDAPGGSIVDSGEGKEGGSGGGAGPGGSLLVSGLEAHARREAEKAKTAEAAAGSMGTKIVVKRKKNRDGGGAGGHGTSERDASRKKKKHKSNKKDAAKSSGGGGVAPPAMAAAAAGVVGGGAAALGGLNLLGSYASSSDSDGVAR